MAGLRWQGLPEERLWDYAPVGCLENTLQGDDRSGTVDVNLNLAKAVELTLNDGRDLATGEQHRARAPATRALRRLRPVLRRLSRRSSRPLLDCADRCQRPGRRRPGALGADALHERPGGRLR